MENIFEIPSEVNCTVKLEISCIFNDLMFNFSGNTFLGMDRPSKRFKSNSYIDSIPLLILVDILVSLIRSGFSISLEDLFVFNNLSLFPKIILRYPVRYSMIYGRWINLHPLIHLLDNSFFT